MALVSMGLGWATLAEDQIFQEHDNLHWRASAVDAVDQTYRKHDILLGRILDNDVLMQSRLAFNKFLKGSI